MASWAANACYSGYSFRLYRGNGAVLFGLSIGSMSGILCSAWLVKRFGTRKVIRTTMTCAVGGMVILSVALWCASPLILPLD